MPLRARATAGNPAVELEKGEREMAAAGGSSREDDVRAGPDEREQDARLLGRIKDRDERALREAIDAFGASIFSTAWRYLRNAALAEEVAQDVLLNMWRHPDGFDPSRGNLKSLLLGITRNKAIDLVRREQAFHDRRDRMKDRFVTHVHEAGGEVDGPAHAVEQRDEVVSALSCVTTVQREIIVLVYFGDRTCREAAEELGIPESTAKTRLRDGLLKLRDLHRGER